MNIRLQTTRGLKRGQRSTTHITTGSKMIEVSRV